MKIFDVFYERMGLNAYALGDFPKAEKWFRRLERMEPEAERTLRNLGVAILAQGRAEEGERYLLKEEKLYGETFHRHRVLADLAYNTGNAKRAAARYAKALARVDESGLSEPEISFLRERLAIAQDQDRYKKSQRAAELFNQGEALRREGKADEALAAFLESVDLDPTAWTSMNNAGVILLERPGEEGRAYDLFAKAAAYTSLPMVVRNRDKAGAASREAARKGR